MRRAMMIMASASGTPVPAIARLVAADEDTVRKLIHDFNDRGLACLDPRWAGGRPRLISDADIEFIVTTATTRPKKLRLPFTRWSIRKLAAYLKGSFAKVDPAMKPGRLIVLERERLRQVLKAQAITFQRTRTWKESPDPEFETKLNRIEHVTTDFPDRCFAFDQFGPLAIRPHHGSTWNHAKTPDRLPATYRRTHGIRYFHGCYSLGDDQLWGINRHRKSGANTLAAIKSIRAARPDGAPIYVILDNLSANTTPAVRKWCAAHNVELCLTPTYASWANPIEAQFGPLRMFTMAASNYPNHVVLARDLQAHLRWRNANARHPDILAAQRRERARIRAEKGLRWGRPRGQAATAA
ncbi:IS630 family transposase [Kineosporia sp. NBRC 101677]|nr:IS630 family transposase [Kineosporia sp. NBRC 101677]